MIRICLCPRASWLSAWLGLLAASAVGGIAGCASPGAPAAAEPAASSVAASAAPAPGAIADPAASEAGVLSVGSPAPEIKVTAHTGEQVDLAKLKGHDVVLYFYPKDDTPGCTKQACDLRDNWDKLQKAGVIVFGVSEQDNASHKAFATKHTLPFPLLPDDKGDIARAFGVPVVNGKAHRVSFLIGKDGKVKHVWPKAATTGHAAEILAQIAAS